MRGYTDLNTDSTYQLDVYKAIYRKEYRVISWGALDHLYFQLLDNTMVIEAVVDQQKYQKGIREWQGVEVISLEQLVNYPADKFVILILADYQQFSAAIKQTGSIYGDYHYIQPLSSVLVER